jgi:hypothetical protein
MKCLYRKKGVLKLIFFAAPFPQYKPTVQNDTVQLSITHVMHNLVPGAVADVLLLVLGASLPQEHVTSVFQQISPSEIIRIGASCEKFWVAKISKLKTIYISSVISNILYVDEET